VVLLKRALSLLPLVRPHPTFIALVVVAALALGASARAHPGAPFWTISKLVANLAAQDRKFHLSPTTRTCRGIGVHHGAAYRHFSCTERNDLGRSSIVYHTTGDPNPDYAVTYGDLHGIPNTDRMFIRRTALGESLVVSGSVRRPGTVVYLQIDIVPDQSVEVSWDAVCSSGAASATRSGSYRDFSGVEHEVRLPFLHPDFCSLSISADAMSSGLLTMKVWALPLNRA
jgi:hypothetical protein